MDSGCIAGEVYYKISKAQLDLIRQTTSGINLQNGPSPAILAKDEIQIMFYAPRFAARELSAGGIDFSHRPQKALLALLVWYSYSTGYPI
jgi:hypothetical protein